MDPETLPDRRTPLNVRYELLISATHVDDDSRSTVVYKSRTIAKVKTREQLDMIMSRLEDFIDELIG